MIDFFFTPSFDAPLLGSVPLFDKKEYFETSNGNRISAKAKFHGPEKIIVKGECVVEHNCHFFGDIAKITIGQRTLVADGVTLKPPERLSESMVFLPMRIGSYCIIGKNSIVRAASIESHVFVGENCILMSRCILESCSYVLPNSVIPPNMVIPPFSVAGGNPARIIGRLSPCYSFMIKEHILSFYDRFKRKEFAQHRGKLHAKKVTPGVNRRHKRNSAFGIGLKGNAKGDKSDISNPTGRRSITSAGRSSFGIGRNSKGEIIDKSNKSKTPDKSADVIPRRSKSFGIGLKPEAPDKSNKPNTSDKSSNGTSG